MKKSVFILTMVCSLLFLSTSSFAIVLPLRVVVNNDKVYFPDAQPFIDSNGRTQTPARFIGEALGATVTWDDTEQKATFVLGSKKLMIYIGMKEYDLDGQKMQMDTAAVLDEGRTYVPARYIAEAFGNEVRWDDAVKTVYVDRKKVVVDKTGTEILSGFVVQKGIDLDVLRPSDDRIDLRLSVHLGRSNVPKQITDMASILSQKCDESTVNQVVEHVKKKVSISTNLPELFIFDNKSQRIIWIQESRALDVTVDYGSVEFSAYYKK